MGLPCERATGAVGPPVVSIAPDVVRLPLADANDILQEHGIHFENSASEATAAATLAASVNYLPMLSITNGITFDASQFWNTSSGIVAGIACGAVAMRILPPLSPAIRTVKRTVPKDLKRRFFPRSGRLARVPDTTVPSSSTEKSIVTPARAQRLPAFAQNERAAGATPVNSVSGSLAFAIFAGTAVEAEVRCGEVSLQCLLNREADLTPGRAVTLRARADACLVLPEE